MRRNFLLMGIGGLGSLAATAVVIAANLPIPAEIYGAYAPAGNCQQAPRVVVSAAGAFIESQAGKSGPLPVDVCYSCAGGARYEGIERWLLVKMGKNQWGDNFPVTLRFNAGEQAGRLEVDYDKTTGTPLGVPLFDIVKASPLSRCKAISSNSVAAPVASSPMTSLPNTASSSVSVAAQDFAKLIYGLMKPTTSPSNTFYDWRFIEAAPQVQWAALPPVMLDKPMMDSYYYRRDGVARVDSQPINVIAGGARTMVMAFYFKNSGVPLGEASVLNAMKQVGVSAKLARCPVQVKEGLPQWYRLTASGRHPAFLWVVPAASNARRWEGFTLSLQESLPPQTPLEKALYKEQCP